MSYVSGDGKPRHKIVLFIIGAIILFLSAYIAIDGAQAFEMPLLGFFRIGIIVGLFIQLIALFKLMVYDKFYIVSFITGIIVFLAVSTFVVLWMLDLYGTIYFPEDGVLYRTLSLSDGIGEDLMLIFFIIATNRLANQSYYGMGKLTVILVIAYSFLLLLEITIFIASFTGFTITIEWVAKILSIIDNAARILKFVGTLVFLIISLTRIKD